ncbi:MAG: glutamine synthetase III [Saprospiraceae bacterium]|nr:glutamine synthetase III [Candidatus Brachybacter algidus]
MSLNRFNAIDIIQNRLDIEMPYSTSEEKKISSFYGENVFNDESMKKYLSESAYFSVKAAIQSGTNLNKEVASSVAEAMKNWAMEKGATHYAHWFQPLTGKTAEKHDSFFTITPSGKAIEEFGGKELAQQEPDGSSFPGGGLRSTFEARGYTSWDPSSPAFILEVGDGMTLCIPTIFVTYGGEALDFKLPLLKSVSYLETSALEVCKMFDEKVERVHTTLGWEQEYFLIDESFFLSRPDLMMTGRTILGKHSNKGQQLEDHYFGSIPERVYNYMRDLETECHKLGIPVRTRHNEVGPGQYELAPMFEEVNIAIDHNQLLMDLMERVARRHKLAVLLHEKPFDGVNGSGKHNNWSMGTNTGKNLLSPGNNPGQDLQFLTFFVNTIRAVREHADLLRASIASASNDHRLGANEAPPAIISIYVGKALTEVLNYIAEGKNSDNYSVKEVLSLLKKSPNLELDNTDRNRTSPFAFTGNKFEIRMVGSTMNCAAPMTIMNTIVGAQLLDFKKELDGMITEGQNRDTAILTILRKYINESLPVLFEGDGYSDEWQVEAAKRGLGNTPNTPDALQIYKSEKTKGLFLKTGIFSKVEQEAHYAVMFENYNLKLDIESKTMADLCQIFILPACYTYQTKVAQNIHALQKIGVPESGYKAQYELLQDLTQHINLVSTKVNELEQEIENAHHQSDFEAVAYAFCHKVKPLMAEIRTSVDHLEGKVEDNVWPLAKYREMMFIR